MKVIPLHDLRPSLSLAGGKGANLALLASAGFPVPTGFCITTPAYRHFVQINHLDSLITTALENDVETASAEIRGRFEQGEMPPELQDEICAAYASLGPDLPVAVRSSATAEDLPDLSFAGQQDTYLNVVGMHNLLEAIKGCWGSLWTARAITYRQRNGIRHAEVALAVIVQELVPAESAGVMFTADPLTGRRDRIVIDATLGLGEALVSGQVEPDHYVVITGGQVSSKTIGAKALAIVPQAGGGTRMVVEDSASRQALADDQILELAALGWKVQDLYGAPQDIEWALAAGKLFLLQARPITSLYPLPEGLEPQPLRVMVSLGAIQGLLEPFTPLGQDNMRALVVAVARTLGYSTTIENQRSFLSAGMRLFINITPILRSPTGRRLILGGLGIVEPGCRGPLEELLTEPQLAPGKHSIRMTTALRLGRLFVPAFLRGLTNVPFPERSRRLAFEAVDRLLERIKRASASSQLLADRLALLDVVLAETTKLMVRRLVPAFAPGMAMLNFLNRLAKDVPDGKRLVLAVTRGMPFNVTTEMDLALWEAACVLKADRETAAYFSDTPASELAQAYLSGALPAKAQVVLNGFLERYGMRGVAELDLGRPRWSEDPIFVVQALQSYLQIDDPNRAPDRVFARSAEEAEQAIDALAGSLKRLPGGSFRAHQARFFARRVRAFVGLRELPKFTIIRLMGMLRQGLIESGRQLAGRGLINRPEDLFYLSLADLEALARLQGPDGAWPAGVRLPSGATPAERIAVARALYERELLRRQVPRLLLSDGRAIYNSLIETSAEDGAGLQVLTGSPVSSGVAEGVVRVVFNPHGITLQPGEILVCPGTDPGWTPLFLAAGALVMEVGGLMTHGSVVAREYGIPAVVGVSQATTRLQTGQRVRVDGTRGIIAILDQDLLN